MTMLVDEGRAATRTTGTYTNNACEFGCNRIAVARGRVWVRLHHRVPESVKMCAACLAAVEEDKRVVPGSVVRWSLPVAERKIPKGTRCHDRRDPCKLSHVQVQDLVHGALVKAGRPLMAGELVRRIRAAGKRGINAYHIGAAYRHEPDARLLTQIPAVGFQKRRFYGLADWPLPWSFG